MPTLSFGQGVLVTPLQMAAAVSSILNGGTYYQPYLVDQSTDSAGQDHVPRKPKVLKKDVVSPQVSQRYDAADGIRRAAAPVRRVLPI